MVDVGEKPSHIPFNVWATIRKQDLPPRCCDPPRVEGLLQNGRLCTKERRRRISLTVIGHSETRSLGSLAISRSEDNLPAKQTLVVVDQASVAGWFGCEYSQSALGSREGPSPERPNISNTRS
jgi:hypothetical protein